MLPDEGLSSRMTGPAQPRSRAAGEVALTLWDVDDPTEDTEGVSRRRWEAGSVIFKVPSSTVLQSLCGCSPYGTRVGQAACLQGS